MPSKYFPQLFNGVADGLTIGLAGCTALSVMNYNSAGLIQTNLIIAAVGGLIMGIGGYFSAKFRMESLAAKTREDEQLAKRIETEKTIALFKKLELDDNMQEQAAYEIEKDREEWKSFLLKNQQNFEVPRRKELPATAFLIGLSFTTGAALAIIPYILEPRTEQAFLLSLWINLPLLLITGFIKSKINREPLLWGGLRVMLLGAAVVAAAYSIAGIFAR